MTRRRYEGEREREREYEDERDERGGEREYGRERGERRTGGRYVRERRREERTVEMVSYGLIIVLFAIALLFPSLPASVISLIGGAILTGSAVFQVQRRWRVNPVTWIGGVFLLVVGLLGVQSGNMPFGFLLPLGVFVVVIVASFVTGEF